MNTLVQMEVFLHFWIIFFRARSKYWGWKPSRRGAASYFHQTIVQQSWNEYEGWSNQSWQPGSDRREKLWTSDCHSSVVKDNFKSNFWLYLQFKNTFILDTKCYFYLAWILGRVHTRNILFRQWLKKFSLLIKTIKCLSKGNKLMCLESRKHFAPSLESEILHILSFRPLLFNIRLCTSFLSKWLCWNQEIFRIVSLTE